MSRFKVLIVGLTTAMLLATMWLPAYAGAAFSHNVGYYGTAEVTPVDVVDDAAGNWYLLDENLNCIKEYAPDRVTLVRILFTCGAKGNDLGHLNDPRGLGIDKTAGRLWIADAVGRVVMVDLGTATVTSTSIPEAGKISVYDIAVDGSGNAYVTEAAGRILKLSPTGQYLGQFGSKGSGNGQLNQPQQIAFSSVGGDSVYALDLGNWRIVKFRTDGTWVRNYGSHGTGTGQLSSFARGVAVDDSGIIYAGDGGGNRIDRWMQDGTALSALGSGLPYYRSGPNDIWYGVRGIAFTDGMLAISDMWNFRVLLWALDGTFISQIGGTPPPLGGLSWPRGVSLDAAGNVYATDWWHEWVQKYAQDGTFLARYGIGRGASAGTLNFPGDLDIDDTGGYIYIANRETHVVDRWRLSDGSFSKRFNPPSGPTGKPWPKDVVVNESTGVIYVADSRNNQVGVVDQSGLTSVINKWDATNKSMGVAESVALDAAGNLYVSDSTNKKVHVYNSAGTWLRSFTTAERGVGIAVQNDRVYVVGKTVYVYSTSGTQLDHWGSVGTADAQLNDVYVGIAVAPDGTVYIANTDNHVVSVFAPL